RGWWLWAWGCGFGFQLVVIALAPALILPWFNRFTPLPEGNLRQRLLGLADRVGFRARGVQVMDGSRRSRHSNAFFAGFGRFRRIVLFDTLLEQLTEAELVAVLAHELGHWKRRHVAKGLLASAGLMGIGFYALSRLALAGWFYEAFGFAVGNITPAFLVFGLLGGVMGFWLTPAVNAWSRRHEYQADAFAVAILGEPGSLIGALRKLNERNLSHLTPDPFYSFFFHSHPTLLEREARIGNQRRQRRIKDA
ncbi:MAG: M48 family metallopeptidase, partial [Verrucomicrobia bacterium]|nr:M48 family metallopeptidase [Verrucomicrobiota bacterium]